MFEKEIDEIYELCKRVANEVPTASVMFNYSIYDMTVCGLKRKEDVCLPDGVFKWDLYQSVSFNPFYEKESRESYWIRSNGKTWENLTETDAGNMLNALKEKYGDD